MLEAVGRFQPTFAAPFKNNINNRNDIFEEEKI